MLAISQGVLWQQFPHQNRHTTPARWQAVSFWQSPDARQLQTPFFVLTSIGQNCTIQDTARRPRRPGVQGVQGVPGVPGVSGVPGVPGVPHLASLAFRAPCRAIPPLGVPASVLQKWDSAPLTSKEEPCDHHASTNGATGMRDSRRHGWAVVLLVCDPTENGGKSLGTLSA